MKKFYLNLQKKIYFILAIFLFNISSCDLDQNLKDPGTIQDFKYYFSLPNNPNSKAKEELIDMIKTSQREILAVFNSFTDQDVAKVIYSRFLKDVKVYLAADSNNISDYSFDVLGQVGIPIKSNKQGNAAGYDGKVEQNYLITDNRNCWISTGGPTENTFLKEFSITFVIHSVEICSDFYSDGLVQARGGLFSDEGKPAFGSFQHHKGVTDPLNTHKFAGYIFNIFFAAQERPLNPVITRLLNAKKSIRFVVRAITQDIVHDIDDHSANRSHLLNILQYKSRLKDLFNADFVLQGIFGSELASASCPVLTDAFSIHCDIKTLLGDLNAKKYNGPINFNLFLIDENTDRPQIILLSSDLRLRFYNDSIDDIYAEPEKTRNDYYNITDGFLIIIEPAGPDMNKDIFVNFGKFIDTVFQAGVNL